MVEHALWKCIYGIISGKSNKTVANASIRNGAVLYSGKSAFKGKYTVKSSDKVLTYATIKLSTSSQMEREEVPDMEEQKPIGFVVKQINNVYEKDFNKRLKTIGITSSQCAVLNYLFRSEKEEVNQRDIERHLSLKNPTVTGLLKRLEDKGFILSVPSNTDKRCKNIHLTEKAYDIQRRMEADRKQIDKRLTIGMTKKEVQALQKALGQVLYNISDV